MIWRLILLLVAAGLCAGFLCHQCTYNLDSPTEDGQLCLNSPAALSERWQMKCGNYCVIQELYDKQLKRVTSLIRSCGKGWGTGCNEGGQVITCRVSCDGNFCNQVLSGDFYKMMGGYGPPTGDSDNNHLGTSGGGRPQVLTILHVVIILFECLVSAQTLSAEFSAWA